MEQQVNLNTPHAIVQTNDLRVDTATNRLSELADLSVAQHAGVYEDIHRRLQEALSVSQNP